MVPRVGQSVEHPGVPVLTWDDWPFRMAMAAQAGWTTVSLGRPADGAPVPRPPDWSWPTNALKRSTAWGRMEYQIQVPRRSPEIQPASRSILR